jgi:hypothetical protein
LLQGTASVVLAGLLAALKVVGGTLADHTYLFLGAGEVGRFDLLVYCISVTLSFLCRSKLWITRGLILFADYVVFVHLQAGTGIAELIALEMSKHVSN